MKPEQTPGDEQLKPEEPSGYEPPLVEDIPADDGPAVVAVGVNKSPPPGPTLRPRVAALN
jgi:hypothetical protein